MKFLQISPLVPVLPQENTVTAKGKAQPDDFVKVKNNDDTSSSTGSVASSHSITPCGNGVGCDDLSDSVEPDGPDENDLSDSDLSDEKEPVDVPPKAPAPSANASPPEPSSTAQTQTPVVPINQ